MPTVPTVPSASLSALNPTAASLNALLGLSASPPFPGQQRQRKAETGRDREEIVVLFLEVGLEV